MAIKIFEKFAPRANPADADYPYGSIKNESVPGAKDGTPLDAAWGNDYAGSDAELFAQAGIVPSGEPDKLGASQRVDAMRQMFSNVGTVADIASGKFKVGARVRVTDRANELFLVSDGGAADGYGTIPAGGVATATIQPKQNVYNIVGFGAVDGAPDNTLPMRAAMQAAALVKGTYFVPTGTWIHSQIDWRDGVEGLGAGINAVDQRLSDPLNPTVTDVSYRFFNTATVAPFDPTLNLFGIHISKINFTGTVVADSFSQYKHLLLMQGVSDVHIDKCWFTGWQGDAVVVRSGNATAAAQNNNVRITNSVFDGINKDNRNAITLNDFDGMWITGNTFRNCTRQDMPGAIDIEPNIGDTFVRLKNCYIDRNKFNNIGGNVAAITVFLITPNGGYTNGDPRNIQITNNTVKGCFRGVQVSQAQDFNANDSFFNSDYIVTSNTVESATDAPFWYYGVKGLTARDNTWRLCPQAGRVGWLSGLPNRGCSGISIADKFILSGYTSGEAVNIYNSERVDIIESLFDNCGNEAGGYGIPIVIKEGPSSKIRVNRNVILNNLNRATASVSVVGSSLVAGGNEFIGNDTAGLADAGFSTLCDFTTYGDSRLLTGIVASPTASQASAAQCNLGSNIVSTVVSSNDSVKLPSAIGLMSECTVVNRGVSTMRVFPFSGDNLGAGTNLSVTVAAGDSQTFRSYDANNWFKIA